MANSTIHIDGIPVSIEETPRSPEELSEILAQSFRSITPLAPVGGGTKLHLGNVPTVPLKAVRTLLLRGITEYEPDNMSVSVLAGTPLRELQAALEEKNQFLPLDPPDAERATVGGIVACNASGSLRFRYGTVRDMLIGVKIVHADGTQTKAGGKLMKNVSGYDMCKLYAGSLGSLGIFTELTFKISPKPEAMVAVCIAYASLSAALEATQALIKSDLLPDAMEAWNGEAFRALTREVTDVRWVLMLRFGDIAEAVTWQVQRTKDIAASSEGNILCVMTGSEAEKFWSGISEARKPTDEQNEALIKCSVLYRSARAAATRMEEAAERLGARLALFCHAGACVIYGYYGWPGNQPEVETLRQELAGLRRHCVAAGGHAVVEKAPRAVKQGFDVWGYEAPAVQLMRRIKQEFDPKAILNPGRFVGGI